MRFSKLLSALALACWLLVLAGGGPAVAQTSTLLPNGKQQFLDANGDPLASGQVFMYVPSTTTFKNTWQDSGNSVLNTNPVVLDAAGEALIYGSGTYRQVLKDVFGNTIWDALTSGIAGPFPAWGGTSTGSGNAQEVVVSSFTLTAGSQIAWLAGFTNSAAMTLQVGSNVLSVYKETTAGPAALTGGEIVVGGVYQATYDSVLGVLHLMSPSLGTMASQNAASVAITGGTIAGTTISTSTIVLKQSAAPAPTAEGDIQWDTNLNQIAVGDGTATQKFTPGPVYGQLWGWGTSNAADTVNDITFAAGQATDSTNVTYITSASAITKRLDAAWAVGTNQGGLFSGAIANTTYFLCAIMRPDTGVVDAGFDTSSTCANKPANYTYYRRVGAVVRSGGTILQYFQNGDYFYWVVQTSDVATANPGTAAITSTLTVPIGIRVQAVLTAGLNDTDQSAASYMLVTALDQTDTAPGVTAVTVGGGYTPNGPTGDNSQISVRTNTSGQVRYRLSFSDGSLTARLQTVGWIDDRGQN